MSNTHNTRHAQNRKHRTSPEIEAMFERGTRQPIQTYKPETSPPPYAAFRERKIQLSIHRKRGFKHSLPGKKLYRLDVSAGKEYLPEDLAQNLPYKDIKYDEVTSLIDRIIAHSQRPIEIVSEKERAPEGYKPIGFYDRLKLDMYHSKALYSLLEQKVASESLTTAPKQTTKKK